MQHVFERLFPVWERPFLFSNIIHPDLEHPDLELPIMISNIYPDFEHLS